MDSAVTVTDRFVFFWDGWPSQWHPSSFRVGDVAYGCAEQFMMAEKARVFNDAEALDKILRSPSPREQKSLGRKVRGFDERHWNSVCRGIVYRGNVGKFEQNAALAGALVKTGDRTIVEASPMDAIWGIGLAKDDPRSLLPAEWLGSNWLGIAIMQVRDHLRRRRGEPSPGLDAEIQQQIDTRRTLPGAT